MLPSVPFEEAVLIRSEKFSVQEHEVIIGFLPNPSGDRRRPTGGLITNQSRGRRRGGGGGMRGRFKEKKAKCSIKMREEEMM